MPLLRTLLALGLGLAAIAHAQAVIDDVPVGVAGFVGQATQGPVDEPVAITSYGAFLGVFGGSTAGLTNPHLGPSVAAFFANEGGTVYVVRAAGTSDAALIGVDTGVPGTRTGMASLLDVDAISIVAIPGAASPAVQAAMIAHCTQAGDRMALLDADPAADVAGVLAQRAGLGSPEGSAALYFPWIEAAPTGSTLVLPPSGFVAGIWARSDPPDSPVDFVLTATDVTVALTAPQIETLVPAGINPIRFLSGQGVRVWGARTIASSPEWIYVAVRRTALHVHESTFEGTLWALDQANEQPLWNDLRASVDAYLFSKYQAGWLQGTKPSEAYFVRVGLDTMTQQDIDEGRTIVEIGIALLRPAEFVVLRVVHERAPATAAPSRSIGPYLLPTTPNPFNPRTQIGFVLERAGTVALEIFDASGRSVRKLVDGTHFAPGRHTLVWNGSDEAGRRVASGVYRLRLRAGGVTRGAALTLVE